jgi:hypothetical protein
VFFKKNSPGEKGKETEGKSRTKAPPKKRKKMPLAGRDSASRARAHLGHARRYSELGQMDKAMAHLGRGLAYGKLSKASRSSFGAGTEVTDGTAGTDGTTDSVGMIALRTLVSEKLTNRLPKLAKEVGVESNLIKKRHSGRAVRPEPW